MKIEEYKKRVVYQIYPASFCDSNNDGWGDINGIISKLDYIKDLGCGIIWLSPIYDSPMIDMGYDVSDYKKINPLFGTMKDFDNLIKECNKRDIKVVMDLVVNHTSSEHKWFKEAVTSEGNKYRDYYYIRKGTGKNNLDKPNNWTSVFTSSAWEPLKNDPTFQYLHLYTSAQPDLNFHNEKVILEVESILKFWLDKGVYGFRCDCINELWKTSLENGKKQLFQIGREFYEDQEGNHVLLKRFRDDVLKKYNCFLVGEDASADPFVANKYIDNNELEMLITFKHQNIDKLFGIPIFKKKFKGRNLINVLFDFQKNCHYNCLYFENHDQKRSTSRFIDKKYYDKGAKALAVLLLTLKGTPFIYQGEEIGMKNLNHNPKNLSDTRDVVVKNVYNLARKFLLPKSIALKIARFVSRDDERTPMQWNDGVNAGFNLGHEPWIEINENFRNENINVKYELENKNSILNFYKKLIKFRSESDILINGDFKECYIHKDVACFKRVLNNKELLIIVNLSNKKIRYKFDRKLKVYISNYDDAIDDFLPPYYASVIEI